MLIGIKNLRENIEKSVADTTLIYQDLFEVMYSIMSEADKTSLDNGRRRIEQMLDTYKNLMNIYKITRRESMIDPRYFDKILKKSLELKGLEVEL